MVYNSDDENNEESRKRQLDDVEMKDEERESKRSNYGGCSLKVLLPSASAGVIIGKSGETMQRLKKESNCRISMSKPNDYYPGTKERVVLIQGAPDSVMDVISFVDSKQEEDFSQKIGDRSKQIKMLIPNETAGVIIGKGGETIKNLKTEAGLTFLGVSSKESLSERIVTIQGSTSTVRLAGCRLILDKVSADHAYGSIRNVNYLAENQRDGHSRPVGGGYMGESSKGPGGPGPGMWGSSSFSGAREQFSRQAQPYQPPTMRSENVNSLRIDLQGQGAAPSLELTTRLVDHVRRSLNGGVFDIQAMRDITAAVGTLASYGLLAPDNH